MAVTETTKAVSVSILLDDGYDQSGGTKTVSVNLGSLNPETYDNTKAMNVIEALKDRLSKTYYSTKKLTTAQLGNY